MPGAATTSASPPRLSDTQRAAAIIMKKWETQTAPHGGFFLRHLDGNLDNDAPTNVEQIHPFDSFSALLHGESFADDWSRGLSTEQIAFVRAHALSFCATYQAVGREQVELPVADAHAAREVKFCSTRTPLPQLLFSCCHGLPTAAACAAACQYCRLSAHARFESRTGGDGGGDE